MPKPKQKTKAIISSKNNPHEERLLALKINGIETIQTAEEALALAGPQFLAWAFARAAQASTNPEDFLGEKLALMLLHKLIPSAKRGGEKAKDTPAQSRAELKRIEALYARLNVDDTEFTEVTKHKGHNKRNTQHKHNETQ